MAHFLKLTILRNSLTSKTNRIFWIIRIARLELRTLRKTHPDKRPNKAPNAWVTWLTPSTPVSNFNATHNVNAANTSLAILCMFPSGIASGLCGLVLVHQFPKKFSLCRKAKASLCQLSISCAKCAATKAYNPPRILEKVYVLQFRQTPNFINSSKQK